MNLSMFGAKRYKIQPQAVYRVWVPLVALALLGGTGCNKSEERRQANIAGARSLTGQYQTALKKELMTAMGAGGPAAAISVCRVEAPNIASHLAAAHPKEGWTVGRTARRVRNPQNAPNDWKKRGLDEIERRLSAGESPEKIEWYNEADGQFRYVSPIMMGDLCVTCHGAKDAIPVAVRDRIEEFYPQDSATGFASGELRGAFVVTGPVGP